MVDDEPAALSRWPLVALGAWLLVFLIGAAFCCGLMWVIARIAGGDA